MKKIIIVCLLMLPMLVMAQKEQVPDTLIWGTRRYTLMVHRDVPSVLMVYYQRTTAVPPFQSWSSENHRGHVATWEIIDDYLCLTSIQALRYKTRGSSLWSASGIDTTVSPDYFDIQPLATDSTNSTVKADWFSGVLQIALITTDKKEQKTDEANGFRLLQIKNGRVVDNVMIPDNSKKGLDENQRSLVNMQQRFLNFYTRAAADREEVLFKGHQGLFEHGSNSITLFMEQFNNDPLQWKKNWENDRFDAGAPFGKWLIQNDSLFITSLSTHWGEGLYTFHEEKQILDQSFAYWLSGDYVIHYGVWQTDQYGMPDYVVSKTEKLRLKNGIILSSNFSPTSFDEDSISQSANNFSLCDKEAIFSVDDKQLAEAVGSFPKPKKNPYYEGEKTPLRNWFLNKPLTDQRAKDRLFRVRIAFLVNCNGQASNFQVINKPKGELFEFSNMVLSIVESMPQKWHPAEDRKGKTVDCWQILEFTISNGILTNANYK